MFLLKSAKKANCEKKNLDTSGENSSGLILKFPLARMGSEAAESETALTFVLSQTETSF